MIIPDDDTMLGKCWDSVADVGPTLNQLWILRRLERFDTERGGGDVIE